MFKISKLSDYALQILTFMYQNPSHIYSSAKLAQELTTMSANTAAKICKLLNTNKLITSLQGVNGGYKIIKAANDINLLDILQSIEGPMQIAACSFNEANCHKHNVCKVNTQIQQLNNVIINTLTQYSFQDFMNLGKDNVK